LLRKVVCLGRKRHQLAHVEIGRDHGFHLVKFDWTINRRRNSLEFLGVRYPRVCGCFKGQGLLYLSPGFCVPGLALIPQKSKKEGPRYRT
jgi:hypothetical protein